LFTIADVSKPDAQTVIARCRELAAVSEMTGGAFRTFLSPAMKRCYQVVGQWMTCAGMRVSVDPAGNLRGVLQGTAPGERNLLMGSHLDTVRDAGAFDGILGVVMSIAITEAFKGSDLPFDLEVVGFSEEEGVRFGVPFIGSKALVGLLDAPMLNRADVDGVTVAQALRNFGLNPGALTSAALKLPPLAFLEFHIEQGPVLEAAGEPVGVVEAIAGQNRASLTFVGAANHAGATPMHLRRDALAGAAMWIAAVEKLALANPGMVATVGKIAASPNIANVIAGEAAVSLDVRHPDDAARERACRDLHAAAVKIANDRGLKLEWTNLLDQKAVRLDESLIQRLEAASPGKLPRLVSGAGHDAMILAPHIPTAMLFLRSPGGVSHSPEENVIPQDVEVALQIGCCFVESLGLEYK
jgi:allantoate deiminase